MSFTSAYAIWLSWPSSTPEIAQAVEDAGFGALWLGSSPTGDLAPVREALAATTALSVATGIVNIWKDDASAIARTWHEINAQHPERFLLGVGVSHPERIGVDYTRPLQSMERYLDGLDDAGVPVDARVVAALGPRMLELAAQRSAGAHPYLTTPAHTAAARQLMGRNALLVPEQKVVLSTDPHAARAIGRPVVANPYLKLVNYRKNLQRFGFSEAELDNDGNDRVVDALVVHGPDDEIKARIDAHLNAGASQVAVQPLVGPDGDLLGAVRRLGEIVHL